MNPNPQDSQFKTAERHCYSSTRYKNTCALALPLLFKSKYVFKYIILRARWKKSDQSKRFNFPFSSPLSSNSLQSCRIYASVKEQQNTPQPHSLRIGTQETSELSETQRQRELQANNYFLITLPGLTLLKNVVIPQAVFSQNHQGSEKAEFISQVFTIL